MGDASTRGKQNRDSGHRYELAVCHYLQAQGWPDACTTRSKLRHAGTRTPGDIDWHPLITLEVKSRIESRWPTWCRQAAAEAPPGTIPVVVRRTRGVTDVGQWECRVMDQDFVLPFSRSLPDFVPALAGSPLRYSGAWWFRLPFADLVAAVRRLDTEGAA